MTSQKRHPVVPIQALASIHISPCRINLSLAFEGFKSIINTFIKEILIKRQAPISFPDKYSVRPFFARFFAFKVPVFRPFFYKLEPVWRIGNTAPGTWHVYVPEPSSGGAAPWDGRLESPQLHNALLRPPHQGIQVCTFILLLPSSTLKKK